MLSIKLFRLGRKNRPHYRIVVMERRSKATGSYIDQIGTYDPFKEEDKIKIDTKKLEKWINKGAQLSEGTSKLLKNYDY